MKLVINQNVKDCPFCGSNKIGYSIKTSGRFEILYHCQMYCKECHTYGPRLLVHPETRNRRSIEQDEEVLRKAINLWNTRNKTQEGGSDV